MCNTLQWNVQWRRMEDPEPASADCSLHQPSLHHHHHHCDDDHDGDNDDHHRDIKSSSDQVRAGIVNACQSLHLSIDTLCRYVIYVTFCCWSNDDGNTTPQRSFAGLHDNGDNNVVDDGDDINDDDDSMCRRPHAVWHGITFWHNQPPTTKRGKLTLLFFLSCFLQQQQKKIGKFFHIL